MEWLREFFRRLQFRFRGAQFDRDMEEEMRLHVDLRSAEKHSDGLAPDTARRVAHRQFGNLTSLTENSREAWGWTWLDRFGQDLRYAARTLAGNPGFTATATLSLVLGIGANSAIFSLINALMLRSLPVADPDRLVQVVEEGNNTNFTNPLWEQIRDSQHGLAGLLAFDSSRFDLSAGGESRFAEGLLVSGSYFRVLGVPAIRGRVFAGDDDRHGGGAAGPVAVISYAFWQREFQGDPQMIGRTVRLDRHPFQIVGVTPSWFTGLNADKSYDVAVPIGCLPILQPGSNTLTAREEWWLHIFARLSPDESVTVAEERLAAATPEILRATMPANLQGSDSGYLRKTFHVQPAGQGISNTGKQYRTALFTLMVIVGLVLLIACANIANLLLARASARRREFSVRMAIGAGRGRIIRQLMTESLLLALLGTLGGLLLAQWGGRLLVRLISTAGNPVHVDLSLDWRSLAFTAGITVLTVLLFGLAPAVRATRVKASLALAAEARGSRQDSARPRLGRMLVAGQIALSLVLLVGTGLFLSTLHNLLTVDLGFDRTNILLVSAELKHAGIPPAEQARAHREIVAKLNGVPGVVSAASSYMTPMGSAGWNGMSYPEGFVPQSRRDAMIFLNSVSPGYFRTMRAPLLAGREFTERDEANAPKVMIINESTARRFFGSAYPIGKTIGMDRPGHRGERDTYEVIGVVKDAKYNRVDEAQRKIGYLAITQDPGYGSRRTYEVLTAGPAETIIPSIRTLVSGVSKDITLQFQTLETQINESLLQPRMVAMLSAVFGTLALVLAMVGLYGTTSYGVARRKGEIGIRMALGAQRESVVWMMLREVLGWLAAGMAVGITGALLGGRYVKTLLFGLQPNDLAQFAAAALVLALAAIFAAWWAARRAARIDPMAALRDE
jgi:putative ABC transport system permease protein